MSPRPPATLTHTFFFFSLQSLLKKLAHWFHGGFWILDLWPTSPGSSATTLSPCVRTSVCFTSSLSGGLFPGCVLPATRLSRLCAAVGHWWWSPGSDGGGPPSAPPPRDSWQLLETSLITVPREGGCSWHPVGRAEDAAEHLGGTGWSPPTPTYSSLANLASGAEVYDHFTEFQNSDVLRLPFLPHLLAGTSSVFCQTYFLYAFSLFHFFFFVIVEKLRSKSHTSCRFSPPLSKIFGILLHDHNAIVTIRTSSALGPSLLPIQICLTISNTPLTPFSFSISRSKQPSL